MAPVIIRLYLFLDNSLEFFSQLLTTDSGIKTVKPKLPTIISILTGIHDPTAEEFHEYRRELADKVLLITALYNVIIGHQSL